MKKAVALLTIAATLLCSCGSKPLHRVYAEDIKKQLKANEWGYTYQKIEPSQNNAYIIDFYVYDPGEQYSKWLCVKINGKIDCDLLFVQHL